MTSSCSQKSICSSKGFTLVEMVMSIVLIGIIAGVLAPILSSTIGGFHDARLRNVLTAQSRVVMERLSREIREADPGSIVIAGGGTSLTFVQLRGLVGLVPVGSSMTKTYNACNTVIVSSAGALLNWDDNGDGATDAVLSNRLAPGGITFTYSPGSTISSGVVNVNLTLADGGEAITVNREIHIRNTLSPIICIP